MQFSVIVPVYNVEKYLPKCLDSILEQQFRDFEVLVVDDGSTDSSGAVCDDYARQDSRIRVIHQENRGLSGARNTGLDQAKGTWIVFVDSDDWIAPEALRILNRQIEKTHADMYRFNICKVSESGESITERLTFHIENDTFVIGSEDERHTFYAEKLLRYKLGWEAWSAVFRRELVEKNRLRFHPTREVFAEDLLFTAQYLVSARKIGVICNYLYYYRQRSNSLMGQKQADTILPRIYRLAEILFGYLREKRCRKMTVDFAALYFYLLNYQIQYTFLNESHAQITERLKALETHPLHQKWSAISRANRADYEKEMVNHQWL